MNQLAIDPLLTDLKLECSDLLKMAERELTSFFNAVASLFGEEQAELSAQEWLREVAKAEHLPCSTREWRKISLKTSNRLASRANHDAVTETLQPA